MFFLDVEFNYPIRHKLIVYHPFYHFKWILKMIQNFHFQKFWVIELNSYVLAELTAMVGIWAFLVGIFQSFLAEEMRGVGVAVYIIFAHSAICRGNAVAVSGIQRMFELCLELVKACIVGAGGQEKEQ